MRGPHSLGALLLLLSCADRLPAPPVPRAMVPAAGLADADVPVRITGEGFAPAVRTDFSARERSGFDPGFRAFLGDHELSAVSLQPDASLSAVVPASLPPGTYALRVLDPRGAEGVLPNAYRAVPRVASFAFDPVGDQRLGIAFGVRVRALDGAGALVDAFSETVPLSDSTGTVAPPELAFSSGVASASVAVWAVSSSDALAATHALSGATGSSNAFVVRPPPAYSLRFESTRQSVVAGTCSAPFVLARVDDLGAPAPPGAPLALSVSLSPDLSASLFADASCATPLAGVTLPAGSSSVSFHLLPARAGSADVQASAAAHPTIAQPLLVAAAAPAGVAFVTPPRTSAAGDCSARVDLELRDAFGNAAPATGSLAVSVNPTPPLATFTVHGDAACSAPAPSSLASGATGWTVYLRGTTAGQQGVAAVAGALPPALQQETILPGPPAAIAFVSTPVRILQGRCSGAVRVQVRDAFANVVPGPWSAAFTVASMGSGIGFFSDAACTQPASDGVAAAGATEASLYLQGSSAGAFGIVATLPSSPFAVQLAIIQAPVTRRTGACAMAATDAALTCAISPPLGTLSRSMLLFQATSDSNMPSYANVRCLLQDASTVACDRFAASGTVEIEWTVLELPDRINVQHLQPTCVSPVTTVTFPVDVDPAATFLLFSSSGQGNDEDANDFRAPVLIDRSTAEIRLAPGGECGLYSLQVVEMPGVRVTRGSTPAMAVGTTSLDVTGLAAADPASSIVLYGPQTATFSALPPICERALRGELISPTALRFTRGAGSGCAGDNLTTIQWERVDFWTRGRVQPVDLALAAGDLGLSRQISPVDLTRAAAFAGGQWASGQATGEGALGTDDIAGEVFGRFTFPAGNALRIDRRSALAAARWNAFVLEIDY